MSYIDGNDDIDDLFRRASEKYPLRTDSSDWDRMAGALEKDPSLILPPAREEEDQRRRRRFFWLFLLLPLGGLGYYIGHSLHTGKTHPELVQSQPGMAGKEAAPGSNGNKTPGATGDQPVADRATGDQPVADHGTGQPVLPGALQAGSGTPPPNSSGAGSASTARGPVSVPGQVSSGVDRTSSGTDRTASGIDRISFGVDRVSSGADRVSPGADRNPENSPVSLQRARIADGVSLQVNVVSQHTTSLAKDTARPRQPKTHSSHYFYAGILAAPDLSMVKFQSVKGVGMTAGVLLGYAFNRRWGVETGLYLDRKKYYTDGEYFKMKSPLPSYYKLEAVNGSCNMLELPVNIRYNLGTGEKRKWFATAGLSTYFMSKENYNYQLLENGWMTTEKSATINKSSQYWFTVINLSMGFEQKLGRIGNLRLEPYLRVPLSGIGTGSLPIMSAGLNIGITRPIR